MLVTINTSVPYTELESLGRAIAGQMVGSTNVYLPKNIDDYINRVKSHKNNAKGTNHQILLANHHKTANNASDATWRSLEYFLQRYGGSSWGDDPGRESITYMGGLEDPSRVALQAQYNESRFSVFKKLPKAYLGRTETDPHTLIVGFKPPINRQTKYSEFLLNGLPDEWWGGVGFITASKSSKKGTENLINWLEQTNVISIGDYAHEMLEDLEVEHAALASMNELYKREDPKAGKRVGVALRESVKDFEDIRDWRP